MTVYPSGPVSRRPGPARIRVSLVLLAASVSPAIAQTPSPPPEADFFPLVRGSTWVYAAEPAGVDIVVDALHTENTACRDPRACAHDHGHVQETEPAHDHDHDTDHEPGPDHPRPAGAKTADTHTYHVITFSVVPRGAGRRSVRLQREWLRRDNAGNLLCARRILNQEEIFLEPPQLILPADPRTEKTWTWSGTLGFDAAKVASTFEAEETVRVPAGTFKALRVRVRTETFRGKGETTRWYASGAGLVKEETRIEVKDGPPIRTALALKSYRIGPDDSGDRHKTKGEKPSPR